MKRHFLYTSAQLVMISCLLAACKTTSPAFPPKADIVAVTEAKPQPTAAILTDPAANDRYNSEVEAAFDRIRAAGVRICRFEKSLGMEVTCPSTNSDKDNPDAN